jgi:hypothetical protein
MDRMAEEIKRLRAALEQARHDLQYNSGTWEAIERIDRALAETR